MKIVYVEGSNIINSKKTGVGNYHFNLLNVVKNKLDLSINIFDKDKNKEKYLFSDFYEYININKYFDLKYSLIIPYKKLFNIKKEDILLVDGFPFILPATSKKIGFIHDLMSIEYAKEYSLKSKFIIYLFFKKARRYNKIITVSQTTKNKIVNILKIDSKKIEVISPGINLNDFLQINNEKEIDIYKKYGIKKPYFLYVGALRKNKNIDKIIEIFSEYSLNNEKIQLVISGDKKGEYLELLKLVEAKKIKNKVIFTGFIEENEKKFLYKNCSLFCFLSKDEGFGIPLLEAMAYKKPILASNIEIFKEITKGKIELVDLDNTEKIMKLIDKSLFDPNYLENIKKIYLEILKEYDIKYLGEKFYKILKELK